MLIFTKLRGTSTTESAFRPAALVAAFQCETWVGDVVRGLLRHVPEVLVVDDGSGDRSAELVGQLALAYPKTRLLREPHRGKAGALLAGASAAVGDY
ncbi:MAG TPA: glycosyltransferase, partial [Thermoanaerobaculia bacterium]|nr:glycosyltransferase [Thermoanaerobaculia bacterium]